eukprot:NODE_2487_length_1569_cov_61.809820_g2141_i0.p1 GENE.NODE_2487_length_1569_cov_61.809820_g2141_i0~~NODE_2487_length_1569_cov_61.809820_g2141_i0.p1  ORF type:complete len:402 (+),score=94.48 NODE_2487_length_1569_cov_61.809820_g2141_i0:58-1206(+)
MSIKATTLSAFNTTGILNLHSVERRKPVGNDVLIRVQFCGICHSDLHSARAEWPIPCHYPMTPGHEITGIVEETGPDTKKFRVGDRVGVGCMVESCRNCKSCKSGEEQYCSKFPTLTYNSYLNGAITHGGYSTAITVTEDFVAKVPDALPLAEAAPLLCAGITTYSPLVHFGAKAAGAEFNVAVFGLGGLGTMAVKISKAMGNNVTVFSRGEKKRAVVERLGAKYVDSSDPAQIASVNGEFDMAIDTISAEHNVAANLSILKVNGKYVIVGVPPKIEIPPFAIIMRRVSVAGSNIGGIRETQEMLDFCAAHGITSDIELIHAKDVNHAFHKLSTGNNEASRYVIKIAETLAEGLEVEKESAIDPSSWKIAGTIFPPEANAHQ